MATTTKRTRQNVTFYAHFLPWTSFLHSMMYHLSIYIFISAINCFAWSCFFTVSFTQDTHSVGLLSVNCPLHEAPHAYLCAVTVTSSLSHPQMLLSTVVFLFPQSVIFWMYESKFHSHTKHQIKLSLPILIRYIFRALFCVSQEETK